jgi:hypothetical protein
MFFSGGRSSNSCSTSTHSLQRSSKQLMMSVLDLVQVHQPSASAGYWAMGCARCHTCIIPSNRHGVGVPNTTSTDPKVATVAGVAHPTLTVPSIVHCTNSSSATLATGAPGGMLMVCNIFTWHKHIERWQELVQHASGRSTLNMCGKVPVCIAYQQFRLMFRRHIQWGNHDRVGC